ncbi:hypothetical protein [Phocaeicola coprophilus]|uniref:hypothetical protein n=1 Tax=Phocaeicola coprophilus TaxID=387090 RepID=UPI0022E0165C|nr:hypothetical protein [Phocaeicola coprophilus]
MKTQKKYEAPQTQHAEVELEQGFMSASVFEKKENTESLTIEEHKVDETFDFSKDSWD